MVPRMPTPAAYVQVVVKNLTGTDLRRVNLALESGIWSKDSVPPDVIPTGGKGFWSSESSGFAVGTAGGVEYHRADGGKFQFRWENPFIGSNYVGVWVPGDIECKYTVGQGTWVHVDVILIPRI